MIAGAATFRVLGQSLCKNPVYFQIAKDTLCRGRDIMIDPLLDFRPESRCDAVSAAIAFDTAPASFGEIVDLDAAIQGCAATYGDCDQAMTDAGGH